MSAPAGKLSTCSPPSQMLPQLSRISRRLYSELCKDIYTRMLGFRETIKLSPPFCIATLPIQA